jgi:S-layer homology domain
MHLSFRILGSSIGVLSIALSSCDRTALQRTFSADPKASQWSTPPNTTTIESTPLPADFPEAFRYPSAVLKKVDPLAIAPNPSGTPVSQGFQTQWSTTDRPEQLLKFYREHLQASPWQGAKDVSGDGVTVLSARQQDQQLSVSIPESSASSAPTEVGFSITYQKGLPSVKDGDGVKSGEVPSTQPSTTNTNLFSDPNTVPSSLKPYVKDVAGLNVLTNLGGPPNQAIKRAMFARWLVEMNNRIYRDRPTRQIRLATASKPAFADVPATHPAFPYVQGLAEAGYLPSPLSGDSTQTRFNPDAVLNRETLLLWKVPIDRQQILPTVSSERVKQLWGFKDVNRITPIALSAVAADHQNGDLSNLRRVLGSTLLLQPQKPVTYAEAAATLWFIGIEGDSLSAKDLLRSEQQTAATETPSPSPSVKAK